jgi:hypothetical protein
LIVEPVPFVAPEIVGLELVEYVKDAPAGTDKID